MLRIASRATKICLLVAVAVLLNAVSAAQTETPELFDLHSKTPKDTTVWFVESWVIDQSSTVDERTTKANTQMERTFGITVKQVDKRGNRIVEIQIARFRGSYQMGNAATETFDSEPTENGSNHLPPGIGIQRMMASVGHRYVARIDAFGKLVGSMAGVAHELQGKKPTSNDQIRDLGDIAETVFGRTPAKPIPINGTWDFVQNGTDELPLVRHATMKLAKVTEGAFEMSLVGTVEKREPRKMPASDDKNAVDPKSPEAQAARIMKRLTRVQKALKITNGKLTGTQRLSRRDGLVLETGLKSTFDFGMRTAATNQSGTMAMTTKLRRTDKPVLKPRTQESTRISKTKADVEMLAAALRLYYAKNSGLPDSLESLTEKDANGRSLIEKLPLDAWGEGYEFLPGDWPRTFQVVSCGPDKELGTDDDISSRMLTP